MMCCKKEVSSNQGTSPVSKGSVVHNLSIANQNNVPEQSKKHILNTEV